MSQNSAILEYLESGYTLTPLQALQMFGTIAMHSRASELRDQGHDVRCEKIKIGNKWVGEYSLPFRTAYG